MIPPENLSVLQPFILSWNLRNILETPSILSPEEFCIIGTDLGEYPIDAWKPLFLETPRDGYKKVVSLPIYSHTQNYDVKRLKILIKYWNDIGFPDDIPCLALAVKCRGFYSDYREAQYVTVLIVWSDAVARIISLDWAEGPLEDCITPEWYVESTSLLNLRRAIEKMQRLYKNISWENPSFSIYAIPSCLGNGLHGKIVDSSYPQWNHEWGYTDLTELKDDLTLLFSTIQEIFFNNNEKRILKRELKMR
jgi:hypothetical protein